MTFRHILRNCLLAAINVYVMRVGLELSILVWSLGWPNQLDETLAMGTCHLRGHQIAPARLQGKSVAFVHLSVLIFLLFMPQM